MKANTYFVRIIYFKLDCNLNVTIFCQFFIGVSKYSLLV